MTLTGPDLSHYQGAVDFPALARACAFAVLKATQGDVYVDPMFAANRAKGRASKLTALGLYHFAGLRDADGKIRVRPAAAEAAQFVKIVGRLAAGEFPVLDWEPTAPPADPVSWCVEWLQRVSAALGVMPVIYVNQSTRDAYDWSPVINLGAQLWLAKYDGTLTAPSSGRWPRVTLKQYTNAATVGGVPGLCDMNVFYGDTAALAALGTPQEDDIMAAFTAQDDALIAKYGGVIEAIAQQSRLVERDADKTYGLAAIRNAIDAVAKQVAAADANDAPGVLVTAILAALPTPAAGGLTESDVEKAIRAVLGGLDNVPA